MGAVALKEIAANIGADLNECLAAVQSRPVPQARREGRQHRVTRADIPDHICTRNDVMLKHVVLSVQMLQLHQHPGWLFNVLYTNNRVSSLNLSIYQVWS